MTLLPKVKLKALVSFPSNVIDGIGTDVVKQSGNFQINLAYDDFAPPVGGVSDPAHANALFWNDVTGQYTLVPLSLVATGGAVPEAPNDGIQYGRQNLSWTPTGGSILPATATPLVDSGSGSVGTSLKYAREDHVHPAGSVGSGDVTGPASAVVDRIAVYNDTTGKLIRDGGKTIADLAPLASPTFTGDPKAPTPSVGDNDTSIATTAFVAAAVAAGGGGGGGGIIRSYLAGLTLSAGGGSPIFGIAAGVACDSTNAVMMQLTAAFTKTTGAWTAGSGNGALDTGAIGATSWYHVFMIRRPDTGVVDVLVSLSATAPTLPSGYTQLRRIGSMKTDSGSTWIAFIQRGDRFEWLTPVAGQVANPGILVFPITLSVPLGIVVEAKVFAGVLASALADQMISLYLTEAGFPDAASNISTNATLAGWAPGLSSALSLGNVNYVFTNTSSQIRCRLQQSASGTTFHYRVFGWRDARGRDD